jgi:acylphosphatase
MVPVSETRAISAVVTGRVQGVGFRYSTQRMASGLGLDGWVRNRYDGSVEAHAQGDKEVVNRFLGFLEKGPPAARVSNLQIAEALPDPSLHGFEVRS